jgi:hypothetical protein
LPEIKEESVKTPDRPRSKVIKSGKPKKLEKTEEKQDD